MFERKACVLAGFAAIAILLAIAVKVHAQPPTTGDYTFVFSQISAGSGSPASAAYQAQDNILVQGTQSGTQSSASYQVINAIGEDSIPPETGVRHSAWIQY